MLVAELVAQGKSRGLIKHVVAPIRGVFNEAIEAGLQLPNPAARIGRFLRDRGIWRAVSIRSPPRRRRGSSGRRGTRIRATLPCCSARYGLGCASASSSGFSEAISTSRAGRRSRLGSSASARLPSPAPGTTPPPTTRRGGSIPNRRRWVKSTSALTLVRALGGSDVRGKLQGRVRPGS